MALPNDLSPRERKLSKELQHNNPDLPGLFVFKDGSWIAHCNRSGTGIGGTPEKAVADLRAEVYRKKQEAAHEH